jgi:tetratricopeptide (TPR) repeat protein
MRVLLGTALVRLHAFAEAEVELRKALDSKPDIPKALRELSAALFGQGKGDEAVGCLQRIVNLDPGKSISHFDLSSAFARIGKHEEAQAALQESFRLDPKRQNLFEAIRLQRDGRPKDAEMRLREILRDDPTNVTATRALGSIALEEGRYKLATRLLRNAVKLAPDYFAAWVDLSRALTEFEQFDDARDAIAELIKLEGSLAYPYVLLGNLESKVGDYEAAVTAFEAALNRQADNGGALAGLGHALKTVGRQEQAIDRYRSCVQRYPTFGEAWWSLANLKTFRFSDDEVAVMEQHVDEERLGDETRVNINFALGKAYEDRGDYDKAFHRYDSGNRLRRPHEVYDPVQNEALHDQIIEMITPQFIEENASHAEQRNDPIFIVGLPRSGSTLIEQILASHSHVDGTHELPDLPRVIRTINQWQIHGKGYPVAVPLLEPVHIKELGKQYLDATQRYRKGASRFTDKMPNNFSMVGLLALILPNAKIINARRHPLDSCMGSYKQLFYRGQSFTYDLVELGEYYLDYQRIMDHWHKVLPGRVLDVQYENMVANQDDETRRLIEFCDLPWEDACLRFYETDRAVNTASSEQVRQPIYSKSINSWRRFESHLGPLVEVLEPLLRQLPNEQQPDF